MKILYTCPTILDLINKHSKKIIIFDFKTLNFLHIIWGFYSFTLYTGMLIACNHPKGECLEG